MKRLLRKLIGALKNPARALRIIWNELVHKMYVRVRYAHVNHCSFLIEGKQVMFDTTDSYSKEWFFPRCAGGTFHEPAVTYLFERLMRALPSFVDVGAHLGYFSIMAAKLEPSKPVLAYEMDDRAYERLARNVQLNNVHNLQIFQTAITAVSGLVSYRRLPMLDSGESISYTGSDDPSRMVEAQSLDDVFAKNGIPIGLIKIDVEGADYEVLTGMEEILQHKPTLLLEIHGTKLPLFSSNSQQVIQYLEARGYRVYEIQNHRTENAPRLKLLSADTPPFTRNTMTVVAHTDHTTVLNALREAGAL